MVRRDFARRNTACRLGNVDGGFEVVAHSQQFFNRIDDRHVVTARFQHACHDGDREFFTPANQRRVDAVRALAKQADTVKNVFNLGKFKFNGAFQLRQRETRLGVGQPLKQIGEDTLGVADIRQCILTTDGFFNHRHQVVRDFGRGREHGGNLPLPGVAFQDIGNTQKTFCICH